VRLDSLAVAFSVTDVLKSVDIYLLLRNVCNRQFASSVLFLLDLRVFGMYKFIGNVIKPPKTK